MTKLMGRAVQVNDGRFGALSGTVIKYRTHWEYAVHFADGKVELLPRKDFKYIKRNA